MGLSAPAILGLLETVSPVKVTGKDRVAYFI